MEKISVIERQSFMGNRSGLWELCLMLNPSVLSCDCKEFRVMFMIHIVKKKVKPRNL